MPDPILRWLHLSDLHFGHGDAHHRFDQKAVMTAILRDAEAHSATHGPPDAIFISGDVAFSAQRAQFDDAQAFLGDLQAAVGVGPEKVFMVPGNHDVDRSVASAGLISKSTHQNLRANPRALDDFIASPSDLAITLWPKLEAYARFSSPLGSGALTSERPFWIHPLRKGPQPIVAVGLNTCLLSFDDEDAPSNLALGKGQLQQAISAQDRDALLLVLMHHPTGWLSDGGELEAFLSQRPHILLCGHAHTPEGRIASTLTGGGLAQLTAGAGHTDHKGAGQHAYAWGALSTEGIRLWPRTFVDKVKSFRAGPLKFKLDGDGCHVVERRRVIEPLETWLKAAATLAGRGASEASGTAGSDPVGGHPHPLQKVHGQLKQSLGSLAGFFRRVGGPASLDEVFVEVCLEDGRGLGGDPAGSRPFPVTPQNPEGERPGLRAGDALRLGEVIVLPHNRWVLLGDPGSGKTTLLHHLSTALITEVEGGDGERTPIFFKLSELRTGWGLKDAVAACFGDAQIEAVLEAAGRGALVILLDGLDEAVDPGAARSAIACISGDAPACQVIVTSRYTGYRDHPLDAPFRSLALKPLGPDEQRRLLAAWGIGAARIATTLRHLHGRPRLQKIAETPLLLTLVALLLREKPEASLPSRRGELYRMALSQFLLREFSPNIPGKPGVTRRLRDPDIAEAALGALALALHGQEGAAYPMGDIREALEANDALGARIERRWGDLRTFLEDVAECTGIIEADPSMRTGTAGAWRFPHRTFREYLAAQALAKDIAKRGLGDVPEDALMGAGRAPGPSAVERAPGELGRVLEDATARPATWSEVLALTCGLMERQSADLLVRRVALARSPELLLRVVAEAENIREDTVWAVLGLESGGDKWEQRREVLEQLPALVRDGSAVIRLVDKFLRQTTNGNDLYFARELLKTLATGEVEGDGDFILTEGDRAQAAALAGEVLTRHRPEAREKAMAILEEQWISIEGGSFWMGSEDGASDEKPIREVTLSAYRLQRVPVTNALYEHFDPGHRQNRRFADRVNSAEDLDRHPVVDVTWYEAQMFAAWMGASLPTEAQWEYAARGPELLMYPWGDEEPNEELSCFNRKYSEGTTDPVGVHLGGAAWCGALDLAGNVLEWCVNWYAAYYSNLTYYCLGPPEGDDLVVRGGSWLDSAGRLRGTDRLWAPPDYRSDDVGFRLAAPRALTRATLGESAEP